MKNFQFLLWALFCTISVNAQLLIEDSLSLEKMIQERLDSTWMDYNIAGTVINVVKDGEVIYSRGLGYQNIESDIVVDPHLSQFRVASITKTFTAIAVLQLVEKGILDLHEDIHEYLDPEEFKFNAPHSFTIHDLLTHTSGMEKSAFRVSKKAIEDQSLETFVKYSLCDQVFPPGDIFYYSNRGYGVLGLLVSKYSGLSFEDYVAEHILQPLEMTGSTVYQHTESNPLQHPVQPYKWTGSFEERQRQRLVNPAASNLNTTGIDMGKFMIAMMNPELLATKGVLNNQSYEVMSQSHFNAGIRRESMAYGFMIEKFRGYKGYNHGGGIEGFGSYYIFFPELQLGLFMSESGGEENAAFVFQVIYSILDRLIPRIDAPAQTDQPVEKLVAQAEKFAGLYQLSTVTKSTFERGQMIFGIHEPVIKSTGDGNLAWNDRIYYPVSEKTYREVDGGRELGFNANQAGDETYMNERLYWTFEKIAWYESATALRIGLGTALGLLLIALFLRPLIARFKKGKRFQYRSLFTASSLCLILGFGLLLLGYAFNVSLTEGTSPIYKIGIWIIGLGFLFFCFLPVEMYQRWSALIKRDRIWMAIAFSALCLLVVCYFRINLIGFHYY